MTAERAVRQALWATVWALTAAGVATGGSIRGVVRNDAKPEPANGLGGAKVWARAADGTKLGPAVTDARGGYVIPVAPDGAYTLVASRTGYVDNPDEQVRVRVAGDAQAGDVRLMPQYGEAKDYAVVADNLLRRVDALADPDAKAKALRAEWTRYRSINLPPSSRAYVARALAGKSAGVERTVPELKGYLDADPKRLRDIEQLFREELDRGKSVPGPGGIDQFNVRPEVVADVALFGLHTSRAPADMKAQLADEFQLKWKGTPAEKAFGEYLKQNPVKGPRERTPK